MRQRQSEAPESGLQSESTGLQEQWVVVGGTTGYCETSFLPSSPGESGLRDPLGTFMPQFLPILGTFIHLCGQQTRLQIS